MIPPTAFTARDMERFKAVEALTQRARSVMEVAEALPGIRGWSERVPRWLPSVAAAAFWACAHRRSIPVELLRLASGSDLAEALQRSVAPVPTSRGMAMWFQTRPAAIYREWVAENVSPMLVGRLAQRRRIERCLVDLGCGDGHQTVQVLRKLTERSEVSVGNVVLVDKSRTLLWTAWKRVRRFVRGNGDVTCVHRGIQGFSFAESVPRGLSVLCLAAFSLHELSRTQKVQVLRNMSRHCEAAAICELESDHDQPRSGTPELVTTAAVFYEGLIRATMSTDCDGRRIAVDEFLAVEAKAVLLNSYLARGNYHMRRSEWLALLQENCAFTWGTLHGRPYGLPGVAGFVGAT